MTPLLETRISVDYRGKPGVLRDFSLRIDEGESVGLVGESGSGKSTVALSILRLLDHKRGVIHGTILFQGRDLMLLKASDMRQVRGNQIALILQSAAASLNPALRISTQLSEAWMAHRKGDSREWKKTALETFERVSLPADERFLERYPRELSVGQAQRVLIAMAVLHRPKLLIADEPTSALDAITQKEVLDLLRQLRLDFNMALLFISHDLNSVASICDRVAILRAGELVETGSCEQIFRASLHEYTQALLRAIPQRPDAPPGYSVSSTSRSTDIE